MNINKAGLRLRTKPYSFYQTVRVFLGCPSDLVTERSKFSRLLDTVNSLRAHSLGFHLEAVGWERVIPSVGRPQSIINKELLTADLVVIMFWNRIGSPSTLDSDVTGTMEEYRLARSGIDSASGLQRPGISTWVYFRKPTVSEGIQHEQVVGFRQELEAGKDLLFWDYAESADWEEMFLKHLVAFLEGLTRSDVEGGLELLRPEGALLIGRFQQEGVYSSGTVLELNADLDGDGNDETLQFKFSHAAYSLVISKNDFSFHLGFSASFAKSLDLSTSQHIAVRDVTNDGLPEILVATFSKDSHSLSIGVWGFAEAAQEKRVLRGDSFKQIGELRGQYVGYVQEGGVIICPYGSGGLYSEYRWKKGGFVAEDCYSPTKKYSVL